MFWTNEYFSCLRNLDARVPQQANKSIYILESGRWPEIPPLITPLLHMVLGINICHGSGTQREVGLKGEFRVSMLPLSYYHLPPLLVALSHTTYSFQALFWRPLFSSHCPLPVGYCHLLFSSVPVLPQLFAVVYCLFCTTIPVLL